jgi:hypothetical protein
MRLEGNAIVMGVTQSRRWMDKVWEAVQEAQCDNVTVEQFKRECAEAWAYEREQQAKADRDDWRKP